VGAQPGTTDGAHPETFVVDLATVDFDPPARLQELNWIGTFTPIDI